MDFHKRDFLQYNFDSKQELPSTHYARPLLFMAVSDFIASVLFSLVENVEIDFCSCNHASVSNRSNVSII